MWYGGGRQGTAARRARLEGISILGEQMASGELRGRERGGNEWHHTSCHVSSIEGGGVSSGRFTHTHSPSYKRALWRRGGGGNGSPSTGVKERAPSRVLQNPWRLKFMTSNFTFQSAKIPCSFSFFSCPISKIHSSQR